MKALLYLEYRTFVNYVKLTLRSPKRLIPVLIGLGWVLFVFHSFGRSTHHPHETLPLDKLNAYMEFIRPLVFGALTLISSLVLTAALSQSLIGFRQCEIDFLVPSGLDRRLIMGSKLLRLTSKPLGLLALLTVMWLAPTRAAITSGSGAPVWTAFLALLVYGFFFLSLYTLVNLIGTYRPGGKWWVSLVVRGLAISAAGFPAVLALGGWVLTGNPLVYLLPALRSPITTTALFPVKWLTDLLLAVVTGWSPMMTVELAGLILLAGVVFAATISRKENPYEPSLTSSLGLVAFMVASHSGQMKALAARVKDAELKKMKPVRTSIPPFGRGAWAFVWKSTVCSRRSYFNVQVVMVLALGFMVAVPKILMAALGEHSDAIPSTMAALFLLPILILFGSLIAGQELRTDLKLVDIVKPMPVQSWHIMAAEAAFSTGLLSLAAWLVLAEVGILYGIPHNGSLLVMALAVPFVIAACTCVQLPISVIYPNWEEVSSQSTGSALTMLLSASVLGLSLLIGVGLWRLGLWRPAVPVAVILFCSAMSIAGTAVGTFLFQRYDPTDE
jgi:hypothetical protein